MPDGPCQICNKEECYAEDMFVECAACLLVIHQGCYGMFGAYVSIPLGMFVACASCLHFNPKP